MTAFYSTTQVATEAKVSPGTVRNAIKNKTLQAYRVWDSPDGRIKILKSDAKAYIASKTLVTA